MDISGNVYRTPLGTAAMGDPRGTHDLATRLLLAMTMVESSFAGLVERCERAGISEEKIVAAHQAGLIRIAYQQDAESIAERRSPRSALERRRAVAFHAAQHALRAVFVRLTGVALIGGVASAVVNRIDDSEDLPELSRAMHEARSFEPLTVEGMELAKLLNEIEVFVRPFIG
jgi:hypothetical protein